MALAAGAALDRLVQLVVDSKAEDVGGGEAAAGPEAQSASLSLVGLLQSSEDIRDKLLNTLAQQSTDRVQNMGSVQRLAATCKSLKFAVSGWRERRLCARVVLPVSQSRPGAAPHVERLPVRLLGTLRELVSGRVTRHLVVEREGRRA